MRQQANFFLVAIAVAFVQSSVSYADNLLYAFKKDRPVYCAHPDPASTYLESRAIPPLNPTEAATDGLKLKQVQVTTRHGTRTLSRVRKCWNGFNPQWDCQGGETVGVWAAPTATGIVKENLPSFLFTKKYDASPNSNKLKNSHCELGQLVPLGHLQQHVSGTMLADAYFKNPDPLKNLFDLKQKLESFQSLDGSIYFRTTENERTTVSGIQLLSSMVKQVLPTTINPRITLHTAETATDKFHPGHSDCADLKVAKFDAWASKDYKEKVWTKNEAAHRVIEKMMGMEHYSINGTSSSEVHDCLSITFCSGFEFPSGKDWTKENVDMAFAVTLEEIEYVMYANNSRFSKIATAPLTYDVKAQAVKQICGSHSNEKSCVGKFFDDEKEVNDMIKHLKAEAHIGSNPFIYASSHGKTFGPFLAAFGEDFYKKIAIELVKKSSIYGGFKTPYPTFASLMALEFYESKIGVLVRMIYNGRVITQYVPGCVKDKELCSVKTFFKAMSWATRDLAQKPCSMKKPIQRHVGSTSFELSTSFSIPVDGKK